MNTRVIKKSDVPHPVEMVLTLPNLNHFKQRGRLRDCSDSEFTDMQAFQEASFVEGKPAFTGQFNRLEMEVDEEFGNLLRRIFIKNKVGACKSILVDGIRINTTKQIIISLQSKRSCLGFCLVHGVLVCSNQESETRYNCCFVRADLGVNDDVTFVFKVEDDEQIWRPFQFIVSVPFFKKFPLPAQYHDKYFFPKTA